MRLYPANVLAEATACDYRQSAMHKELLMTTIPYRTALIVGAGAGISASVARGLTAAGLKVGVAARDIDKLAQLAGEIGAERFAVDASSPAAVAHLFEEADARLGTPDVVLYNASARAHGPIAELDPEAVRKAVEISAFGGFLVVQQAARRMIPRGGGAILLTGASASVKGYPLSAAFAMGKFALRGLAQSVARELGPKGIHVAHFVIDGGVRSARRPDQNERPDSTLDPDAIAQTYLDVLRQPRSAWSLEVEMRPWVETF
jgi:NAD(P)-dependent dehydrogenase (short-subunit alcohol dehydrogenase family)